MFRQPRSIAGKCPEYERDEDFKQEPLTTREITWTDATWCLRLYPNGKIERETDSVGLTIVRARSRALHHKLWHCIKCDNKEHCYRLADIDNDHNETPYVQFTCQWKRQSPEMALSSPDEPSLPVEKDSINVVCHMTCYRSHTVSASSQTELLMLDKRLEFVALCQDFKSLLLNGQDHDVILRVKDKEFRAHRNILRARSPVLESMLRHDMIEKNSGVIEIPDCEPDAIEQFLFYIYSGEVETLDILNMLPLYYVADKYDVGPLKVLCRDFIKRALLWPHLFDVIELALRHNDTFLLECTTEFFVKEMHSIVRTDLWQSFMRRYPTEANELIVKGTDKWCAGNK